MARTSFEALAQVLAVLAVHAELEIPYLLVGSFSSNYVRKVMSIQYDKLDWEYILKWTVVHGTSELMERLRMDAGTQK